MKAVAALSLDVPRQLEHELFRACMQIVVGVEQHHSDHALRGYAKKLRALATQHIGPDAWRLENGERVSDQRQIWGT